MKMLVYVRVGGDNHSRAAHPNVDKHLHNRYAGAKEIDTREREGGREGGRQLTWREAADVDMMRVPSGLNLSPCQRLG